MSYDVFLSYHWRDHVQVEVIAQALRERGLEPFLDRWYLAPGQPWPQKLEQVLRECRSVAVLIGPEGLGPWQQREKYVALDRQAHEAGFPVIPVLLAGAEPAADFLALNTWVSFGSGVVDPAALEALAKAIRGEPPGPQLLQRAMAGVRPFRGLRAFHEQDAPFFFGREGPVERLSEKVERQSFVALIGASGSGKSSVARAGLVPRLRRRAGGKTWEVLVVVPGERPLHALGAELLGLIEPDLSIFERHSRSDVLAAQMLKEAGEGRVYLSDLVSDALARQPGTDRLLLLVDQWEELYTLTQEQSSQRRFVAELLNASARGPLSVLITMRGDFFGHALADAGLEERLRDATVTLGPMSNAELRAAVERPLERVQATFESGLVGRILDDAGEEPGALPMLEFVLEALWDRRQGGMLLHETYEKDLHRLRGAIAKRADEVFELFAPPQQKTVRQLFLQLVRAGENAVDTRRRASVSDIGGVSSTVIDELVRQRLIVTSRDAAIGQETIEIAHEALIGHWAKLRAWLDDDREFLLWRQRLRASLSEWVRAQEDEGALLRGAPLSEAERWQSERAEQLAADESRFIGLGVVLREREALRREEEQRRLRKALAIAERERGLALARQLAAQAELTRSQQANLLHRSALLATESLHRAPEPEACQILRQALVLLPRTVSPGPGPIIPCEDGRFVAGPAVPAADERLATRAALSRNAGTAAMIIGPHGVVRDTRTGRETVRITHDAAWTAVALSPDGLRAAFGAADGAVRVLSTQDGAEMCRLDHSAHVGSLSFSTEGSWLAAANGAHHMEQSAVHVWEVPSGSPKALDLPEEQNFVAFSPTRRALVTACLGVQRSPGGVGLNVWGFAASGRQRKLQLLWSATSEEMLFRLAFSPDGEFIAAASREGYAVVWSVSIGNTGWRRLASDGAVRDIAFSPDGTHVATASLDHTARLWETVTAREVARAAYDEEVFSVAFSLNGELLAAWTATGTRICQAAGARAPMLLSQSGGAKALIFSENGEYQESFSLDPRSRRARASRYEHAIVVPNPNYVALSMAGADGWVWDATGPKKDDAEIGASYIEYLGLLESAAGKRSQGDSASREIARLVDHRHQAGTIALSPDGLLVATADGKFLHEWREGVAKAALRGARVWRLGDPGPPVARLEHEAEVDGVAFSPQSDRLATADRQGHIAVWIGPDWRLERRWRGAGPVEALTFSPGKNACMLVSVCATSGLHALQAWRCDGSELMRLEFPDPVRDMTLTSDGRHLATATADNIVRVWKVPTGREVARLYEPGFPGMRAVEFSTDDRLLATLWKRGDDPWVLSLSAWRPDDLLAEACQRLYFTQPEWLRYLGNEPYRKTCEELP